MSDDLVKRLREPYTQRQSRRVVAEFAAADRIEQLVAINEELEENLRLRTAERNYANDVVDTYVDQVKAEKARAEAAEAKLAEADAMIEAQQKDYASNNVRFAEAEHRAKAAEAALPAVYRLALKDAAAAVRKAYNATENFYSMMSAPSELPTPTAAELMARIQTGEKQ